MASLIRRAIGAIRLDSRVYEDVENDESAMGQAITIVVISSLASGMSILRDEGFIAFAMGAVGGADRLAHVGLGVSVGGNDRAARAPH